MPDNLTARARRIVRVAREMLENEGPQALTMRRLADRLGIRAPSLYKHFPHKGALELAIIVDGFGEAAAAFEAATAERPIRCRRSWWRIGPLPRLTRTSTG